MRHLPDAGLSVGELERRARTPTNLAGMERWRYITVAPDPADTRSKPPRRAWIVRPTRGGRMAQEIWSSLAAEIEKRWEQRFGAERLARLGKTLATVNAGLDLSLPECMPILGYGLFTAPSDPKLPPPDPIGESSRPLYALLSRPLVAMAIEFENGFTPSLAIGANLLRVLDEMGVRVRDLPRLSGVTKEALSMVLGFVQKARLVVVEPNPDGSAFKVARLTASGLETREAYIRRLAEIEDRWSQRFGNIVIRSLRESLEELAGQPGSDSASQLAAIAPYPDGWRASVPSPATLPHFPMVLHRGGYPDGS